MRFWLAHAIIPGACFCALAVLFESTHLDLAVGDAFFDAGAGYWPYHGSWWADGLIHDTGHDLVVLVLASTLLAWLASLLVPKLRAWRRATGYLVLCGIFGAGTVAIGKRYSNIDCPWDLDRYGGTRPYVRTFADRPDDLPRACCFPGGHSSGAFSLLGFYFVFRRRRPVAARRALVGVLLVGTVFSIGQWARGAHFPSHDVWSAAICWFAALALYTGPFRSRLLGAPAAAPEGQRTAAGGS